MVDSICHRLRGVLLTVFFLAEIISQLYVIDISDNRCDMGSTASFHVNTELTLMSTLLTNRQQSASA